MHTSIKIMLAATLLLALVFISVIICNKKETPASSPAVDKYITNIPGNEKRYIKDINRYRQEELKTKKTLATVLHQLQLTRLKNKALIKQITTGVGAADSNTRLLINDSLAENINTLAINDSLKDEHCNQALALQTDLLVGKDSVIHITERAYSSAKNQLLAGLRQQQHMQKEIGKLKVKNSWLKITSVILGGLLIKKLATR